MRTLARGLLPTLSYWGLWALLGLSKIALGAEVSAPLATVQISCETLKATVERQDFILKKANQLRGILVSQLDEVGTKVRYGQALDGREQKMLSLHPTRIARANILIETTSTEIILLDLELQRYACE